jgi:5-(carboxyamino)imidazole ribonucleotide synthase
MFLTESNQLLVNEIAPRVHNSGHLTIEANVTSQFQQHIRAITGLPLGRTERLFSAAMANILYGPITFGGLRKLMGYPYTYPHFYGKEPRDDGTPRKIGHITTLADNPNEAVKMVAEARKDLLNDN